MCNKDKNGCNLEPCDCSWKIERMSQIKAYSIY